MWRKFANFSRSRGILLGVIDVRAPRRRHVNHQRFEGSRPVVCRGVEHARLRPFRAAHGRRCRAARQWRRPVLQPGWYPCDRRKNGRRRSRTGSSSCSRYSRRATASSRTCPTAALTKARSPASSHREVLPRRRNGHLRIAGGKIAGLGRSSTKPECGASSASRRGVEVAWPRMAERRAACSCGQLTVTVEGDPVRISMCHCLACQRRTGSAFGLQARFPADRVRIDGAPPNTSGSRRGRAGALLLLPGMRRHGLLPVAAFPDVVAVPVGGFADRASHLLGSRSGSRDGTRGWLCPRAQSTTTDVRGARLLLAAVRACRGGARRRAGARAIGRQRHASSLRVAPPRP